MRAVVYTRISEDRAGEGLGVARQERECRDLAKRRGWKVVKVRSDNDVSATSGKPRAGYLAMLEDVRAGLADVIIAWHPDRLHRSVRELEDFIDLVQATGTKVVTVKAGEYDLSTHSGQMLARIVGAVARHEADALSARIKAKHRELALAGKPTGGGTRPFGFLEDRISHHPEEAEEIRQAARCLLAGQSMYSILTDWQARGVVTPTGKRWRPQTFRRMICSARIAGLREHGGEIVGSAVWEPIISEADHYAINALFADPSRRPSARPRAYLLTGGLVRCGLCGGKLVARPRGDRRRCYVCAAGVQFDGCGKIRILADPLEEHVRDRIAHRLAGPALAEALARVAAESQDQARDFERLRVLEGRQEQLARAFAEGRIGEREWLAGRDQIQGEIDSLRDRIAATATSLAVADLPSTSDAIRALWDGESVEWRRRLVGLLIDEVTVGPAVRGRNFFDPGRVTIRWRV